MGFSPHKKSVPFEPGPPKLSSGQEGLCLASWAGCVLAKDPLHCWAFFSLPRGPQRGLL